MMAIIGPYTSTYCNSQRHHTSEGVSYIINTICNLTSFFLVEKKCVKHSLHYRICRKNQSLFVRQHAHCIQMRICMPEEDGYMLSPISTFMILEVKPAKSLRISFIAAEWSSSSESTKSSLKAGTLTFSGSKKSRLLLFSVESGWIGLFSGAL